MTTVAWKDGMLAADSRATGAGGMVNVQKVFSLPDGRAVGFSGDLSASLQFVEVLKAGAPEKFKARGDFIAAVMDIDGSVLIYESGKVPIQIHDKFYAIGSGGMAALGAMACGKSAKEAVKIAARFDENTGGHVNYVYAKRKRKRRK